MRKETVKDVDGKERDIEVIAISRKKLKELKKYGFSLKVYKTPIDEASEQFEEGVDEVFLKVLKTDDIDFLDSCSPGNIMKVWLAAISETYGSVREEKNLKRSGSGDQTENELNIAATVEKETKTKVG